jgi:hypothetical protein
MNQQNWWVGLCVGLFIGQALTQAITRYRLRKMIKNQQIRVHPNYKREDPCQWEWSHGKHFNEAHEEQLRHDIENGLDIL